MLENIVDSQGHVDSIVESLLISDESWTVVSPPSFGGAYVADQIATKLRGHSSSPLVAVLSPDNFPDTSAYIQELRRQWSQNCQLLSHNVSTNDSAALTNLMYHDLPAGRRAIQIIDRFHGAITRLGDWVLGALRNAEHQLKIRSVVITPYDLMHLRDQWRDEGHVLTVSNYGDTHRQWIMELDSIDVCVTRLEQQDVPRHIAEFCVEVSGGYPEILYAVVREWRALGMQHLVPDVRRKLSAIAQQGLVRLVRRLDSPSDSHYRDALMKVHVGVNSVDAYSDLEFHPWKRFLMRGDRTLRASELGNSVILDEVRRTTSQPTSDVSILNRAESLYRRCEYDAANQITSCLVGDVDGARSVILIENTRIMYRFNQIDFPGNSDDWKAIRQQCIGGKERIKLHTHLSEVAMVVEQYEKLAEVAAFVESAAKRAQANHQDRVLDVLGGLFGHESERPHVAIELISMLHERSKTMPGDVAALESAMVLPEQAFRLWAFWSLKLNYYSSPSPEAPIWDAADQIFMDRLRGDAPLRRRPEGQPFSSFQAFAAYCLAFTEQAHCTATFITNPSCLAPDLSVFDSLRNPRAHAVCSTRTTQRKKFFELCDRWIAGASAASELLGGVGKTPPSFSKLPLYDDLRNQS